MTYPFRKTLVAAVVALALPGALYADDKQKDGQKQQSPSTQNQSASQQSRSSGGAASAGATQQQDKQSERTGLSQISAKDLKNLKVVDAQGKDIGEISEVVVDLQSGRIHAAVVEFGGFMGLGEKHYAFPVSELKPGKQANQIQLNVDKEKLKNAEGFAKNQWPAMGDEYWGRIGKASAGSSQGQKSQGSTQQAQGPRANLARATQIIGKDVQDKSGQEVGDIADLMLDLRKGQITNVVLDVKDGGQAKVPPKSLTGGTGDKYVTNMTKEQLSSSSASAGGSASAGASSGASSQQGRQVVGDGIIGVPGKQR